jgi:hypothetical protein
MAVSMASLFYLSGFVLQKVNILMFAVTVTAENCLKFWTEFACLCADPVQSPPGTSTCHVGVTWQL